MPVRVGILRDSDSEMSGEEDILIATFKLCQNPLPGGPFPEFTLMGVSGSVLRGVTVVFSEESQLHDIYVLACKYEA